MFELRGKPRSLAAAALVTAAVVSAACTKPSSGGGEQPDDPTIQTQSRSIGNNTNQGSYSNRLESDLTEYRRASRLDTATVGPAQPSCVPNQEPDGRLTFGGLLPETGPLAYLGPGLNTAARLAIADINANGGVLGQDVVFDQGDSGGDLAERTVERHVNNRVDIMIGPASSPVAAKIRPRLVEACRVLFSPAVTDPGLTVADVSDDLFFRTSPSDVLQGQALADLATQSKGSRITLVATNDPYGQALLGFTKNALEAAEVRDITIATYDAAAIDANAVVETVKNARSDIVVVIGFEESSQLVSELLLSGFEGSEILLSDGNTSNLVGQKLDSSGSLKGVRGVLPGAEVTSDFKNQLIELNPKLEAEIARVSSTASAEAYMFGPETYDAVIITALAAELAQSDNPADVARQINGVTRDGQKCNSFSDCKNRIARGETDIDYDGVGGSYDFDAEGDPAKATFTIAQFG